MVAVAVGVAVGVAVVGVVAVGVAVAVVVGVAVGVAVVVGVAVGVAVVVGVVDMTKEPSEETIRQLAMTWLEGVSECESAHDLAVVRALIARLDAKYDALQRTYDNNVEYLISQRKEVEAKVAAAEAKAERAFKAGQRSVYDGSEYDDNAYQQWNESQRGE